MSGWRDLAACAEVGPELFFPDKGGRPVMTAQRICARCEVRAECLAEGLAQDERDAQFGGHGVWGGLSPAERRRLRKGEG